MSALSSRPTPQSSFRPPPRFYMPPLTAKNSLYKMNHSQKTEEQSTRYFTSSSSSLLHPSSLFSSYFSPPPFTTSPLFYPLTSSFPPSSPSNPQISSNPLPPSYSSLLFPPNSCILPSPSSSEIIPPPATSVEGKRRDDDWIVKKIQRSSESDKNEFFLTSAVKSKFKINSLLRERINYFEKNSETQVRNKLLSFPTSHTSPTLTPSSLLLSVPSLSCHKRYFLIVDNTLMQKKPKFVYLEILFGQEGKADFGKLKNLLGGYFHMNPAKIFLFFKNGDIVRRIIDLDRNDSTVFLSANSIFQKMDLTSKDKEMENSSNNHIKIAFLLYIKQLEIPLRIVNKREVERTKENGESKNLSGRGREENRIRLEDEYKGNEELIMVKSKTTYKEEQKNEKETKDEEEKVRVKIRKERGEGEYEGGPRSEELESRRDIVNGNDGTRKRDDQGRRYVMSSERIERVYQDLKRGNFKYGDIYETFSNQIFDHTIGPKKDRKSIKKERILRKFQSKRKFSIKIDNFRTFQEEEMEENRRKEMEGERMEEEERMDEGEGVEKEELEEVKMEERRREEEERRKEEEKRKNDDNKRIIKEERGKKESEKCTEEEEDLEKMADNLDKLIEKWSGIKKKRIEKEGVEFEDLFEEKKNHIDYIETNKRVFMNRKSRIGCLRKKNKELFLQNIPKMIQETNLSRNELHSIYILYKVLQEVTSQKYVNYNLDDGLDYNSFKSGIYQVFVQSEEMSKRIFKTIDYNFSGFLNWSEFLQLMVSIRAKSMREKIDLFIHIADRDQNGQLSKQEVFDLCKICLGKFIKEDPKDPFLMELCDYFTRLIFNSVNVSLNKEISLKLIKKKILEGGEESNLLAMFCGADI